MFPCILFQVLNYIFLGGEDKMMKKLFSIHLIVLLVIASVMLTPVQASTITVKGGAEKGSAKAVSWISKNDFVTRMTASKKHYWFKFKTCSDSRFYTIKIKNCNKPGYVDYYLTDNSSASLNHGYIWKGESREINMKLKSSRYYYLHLVNYSGSDPGNVKFSIKSRKDVVGDTRGSAKLIAIGKTYTGTLDGSGDVDYIKFKPAVSGSYNFVVKNCNYKGNMNFSVMDRYEDTLGNRTYYTEKGGTITANLTKNNWYYVKINGYGRVGAYKVTVKKK